jgi:hypothetical protein
MTSERLARDRAERVEVVGIGRYQIPLGRDVSFGQLGNPSPVARSEPARARLAVVLIGGVVLHSRNGRRARDVVEQAGGDELQVLCRGRAGGQCGGLQRVLELVDRLAVVGEASHRLTCRDRLLEDRLGGHLSLQGSV